MVIDVHRDAVELSDGSQMGTSATVNGEPSAQVMLVMGTDEGGTHPPRLAGQPLLGLEAAGADGAAVSGPHPPHVPAAGAV